jgi:hypothetical protein
MATEAGAAIVDDGENSTMPTQFPLRTGIP